MLKTRTLKDKTIINEYPQLIELSVSTHAPEKYRTVDLETGQVWAPLVNQDTGAFVRWKSDKALEEKIFSTIKQQLEQRKGGELVISFVILIVIFVSLRYLPAPWGAQINASPFYFFLQYAIVSMLTIVAFRLGAILGVKAS